VVRKQKWTIFCSERIQFDGLSQNVFHM
jgi:hypothetical protein